VVLLAGVIPLAGRAILIPVLGIPKPAIQDEFAYLLAADTFAHGRLTNPTHPMADHFETLQEIFHPTYASKYPPFSSMLMALGEKLSGQPWIGVWLSVGIMCAALAWALQGWLSPVWAIVGTLIAVLRIGTVSYWTETYWGGSCAAIGGALVIGAIPRLIRRPGARLSIVLAAGLAILANTRPYEGMLLALVMLGYLIWAWSRRSYKLSHLVPKVILPMALILIPAFAWMGYYNYRVTGNPLEMPYMALDKQYNIWSPWLWRSETGPPPQYSNAVLRDFWINAYGEENRFAREHILKAQFSDLAGIGRFFLGWPLILCLLAAGIPLAKDRTGRRTLLLGTLFYAGCAMDARVFPHYVAPGAALLYILASLALRAGWHALRQSPAERRISAAGLAALFVVTTAWAMFTPKNRYYFSDTDYHVKAKWATVEAQLEHEPGEHLVLVSYGSRHDMWEELVYNKADIDTAHVVWARSLGPVKDAELMRYYPDRVTWRLEENGEVKLERYLPSTQSTTPTQLGRVIR
jgi:hypothetical protein